MDTLQLLAAAIVLLLFVQALALVVAVRILGRTMAQVATSLAELRAEIAATLLQTRATLDRVEKLARSSDQLVTAELTPTIVSARAMIGEVETSARNIREGVDGLQNTVRSVASAGGSSALAFVAQTIFKRGGKLGLLALGLSAAARAFLTPSRRQARATTGRKSHGTR
jgi:uncharacterized protein YoxC